MVLTALLISGGGPYGCLRFDAGNVLANPPRPRSVGTEHILPEFLVHDPSLGERRHQELRRELFPIAPEVRQLCNAANRFE